MKKNKTYIVLLLIAASGLVFFQNCSKTNFGAASTNPGPINTLSCDNSKKPPTLQRPLTCPSGIGSVSQTSTPVCTTQNLWAAGPWLPTPVNYSTCGCPVTGQRVSATTGLCACPIGQFVVPDGSGNKCSWVTCTPPAEPATEDLKDCPYNPSGKILRTRVNVLDSCVWQQGAWSSWNSSQCSCPAAGQTGTLDQSTVSFTCSCPPGNIVQDGRCVQPPACDPLATSSSTICDKRLKAKLYFQPGSPSYTTGWSDVNTYIQNGNFAGEIYFSDLFIPTRSFSTGFPGVDNRTEYFALDITTKLQTSPQMPAGNYQLGIISDDGSIISYLNSASQEVEILNQNQYTPSMFGCATQNITLVDNQKISLRIRYFQAPKVAMGLVLLFRPWAQASFNTPFACGTVSENMFGPFPVPVRTNGDRNYPGTSYEQLLNQGWKPIPSHSFTPIGI